MGGSKLVPVAIVDCVLGWVGGLLEESTEVDVLFWGFSRLEKSTEEACCGM
jgi:hypothetical protein